MSEPVLLVIAGCNGSGKSSFSKYLVPTDFSPFDYDIQYLKYYRSLFDSEIREEMAHNLAFEELKSQIESAISYKSNFCYETNFNSTPLFWPEHFKQNGYKINLLFFAMNSIDEAKRRVSIRVQNGGHFVPESEIEKRYYEGFDNLNTFYQFFDCIDIFDTSANTKEPICLLSIEDGVISQHKTLPYYLRKLIPEIAEKIV